MINIAILTSGAGAAAASICQSLNHGSKVKVRMIVTDNPGSAAPEMAAVYNSEGCLIRPVTWDRDPKQILNLFEAKGIEYIVLAGFDRQLKPEIKEAFLGRCSVIPNDEPLPPAEIDALVERVEKAKLNSFGNSAAPKIQENPLPQEPAPAAEEPAPAAEEPAPAPEVTVEEVDRQWAETLGVPPPPPDFYRNKETPEQKPEHPRQTPPPLRRNSDDGYGNPAGPADSTGPDEEPMPPTYLIWSILCCVFCCLIPAIIAIIYSSRVSQKYYTGDLEGAKKASETAQIWIIVSFVLGLLSATLYIPVMMASGGFNI